MGSDSNRRYVGTRLDRVVRLTKGFRLSPLAVIVSVNNNSMRGAGTRCAIQWAAARKEKVKKCVPTRSDNMQTLRLACISDKKNSVAKKL